MFQQSVFSWCNCGISLIFHKTVIHQVRIVVKVKCIKSRHENKLQTFQQRQLIKKRILDTTLKINVHHFSFYEELALSDMWFGKKHTSKTG